MDLGVSSHRVQALRSCCGGVAGVAGRTNSAIAANRGVRIQRSRQRPAIGLGRGGTARPSLLGIARFGGGEAGHRVGSGLPPGKIEPRCCS